MTDKDNTGKLRFAVMVNSMEIQNWQYESIEALVNNPKLEPVLIIMNDESAGERVSLWKKITGYSWQNVLFKKYYQYCFKPESFVARDVNSVLPKVDIIRCRVKKKKNSEYFDEGDIRKIVSYEPDFILKYGFGIIKGDILTCTPYGIWSFHHGDEQKYRGVPPAFWEIYGNDHRSGAILQRLTEKLDSGVILRKGLFKTIDHSWKANLKQSIDLSKYWPNDVCNEILNQKTFPDHAEGVTTTAPVYKMPGNTTFVLFLLKLFINKLRFHYNELFSCEVWQCGIIKARTADLLGELQYQIDPEEVDWLKAKNNNFYYADIFAIKESERLMLLFEDYSYHTRKGHLSVAWFNERDYSLSKVIPVLEESWHLSYPFIFKYKGTIYCIPESKDGKNVELYKFDLNSTKMIHVRTLIPNLEAVDPTLIYHQNHWYLFFTAGYASNVELHIWHAENLEDEFIPHVLNPVKSNVSNSRPAGSLFYLDGKLYRPAQDCSRSYGARIIINEVKILSEDSFLEMAVNVLEPPAPYQGLHNLSFAGDSMLFDCKKMAFSWVNFFYQLKRKIGNIL